MEKSLSISICIMVILLVTFSFIELEAHVVLSHGLPEGIPTGLLR